MVSRAALRILALALVGLLAGCASLATAPDAGRCRQLDDNTVRLSGPVDAGLAACASRLLTPLVTRVVVDSRGGLVSHGREIGYKIGVRPRTLVIDGACLSACGNYFVPAAARIEALPGSVIGLHGSPDPDLLERSLQAERAEIESQVARGEITRQAGAARFAQMEATFSQNLAEEAAFAAHFGVPKGWRLYRDAPASGPDAAFLVHFTGAPRPRATPVTGPPMLIVEPDMLDSCLPRIDGRAYRTQFEATILAMPERLAQLESGNGVLSGTLRCKPERSDPSS